MLARGCESKPTNGGRHRGAAARSSALAPQGRAHGDIGPIRRIITLKNSPWRNQASLPMAKAPPRLTSV